MKRGFAVAGMDLPQEPGALGLKVASSDRRSAKTHSSITAIYSRLERVLRFKGAIDGVEAIR